MLETGLDAVRDDRAGGRGLVLLKLHVEELTLEAPVGVDRPFCARAGSPAKARATA
jgi:hypothetical protein